VTKRTSETARTIRTINTSDPAPRQPVPVIVRRERIDINLQRQRGHRLVQPCVPAHVAKCGKDQRRPFLPQRRAKASIHPVIMPGEAVFNVMASTERQFGTPSAKAASRTALGTINNISSVVRQTVGTHQSMASATPPERAEKCPAGELRSMSKRQLAHHNRRRRPFSTSAVQAHGIGLAWVPRHGNRPEDARRAMPTGNRSAAMTGKQYVDPEMGVAMASRHLPDGLRLLRLHKESPLSETGALIDQGMRDGHHGPDARALFSRPPVGRIATAQAFCIRRAHVCRSCSFSSPALVPVSMYRRRRSRASSPVPSGVQRRSR